MCEEESVFVNKESMFFRHQLRQNPLWQNDVLNQLSKEVYITIDLDAPVQPKKERGENQKSQY